ncbi:MAG TPA: ABC transporter permease [Acidobacteriaceae bacterium]|jgi:putative ABC transport system permease protein|nr:ABC transporter permease [Acidobacteriaceae bacterium]
MLKTLAIVCRSLLKQPAFTAIAVLTIALGVGASTAIFSVTNAVLLRPLPYKNPGQLVVAGFDMQKRNVRGLPFSNADYIDLKNGTKGQFSDMAGVFAFRVVGEKTDGTPERFMMATVTTNFFDLMGAKIVAGRDFNAQDGIPQPPAAPAGQDAQGQGAAPAQPRLPQMAILSHEYFMKRYGGNAAVLGHTLGNARGPNAVIVGVLAPGFRLYFPPEDGIEAAPDVWVANRLDYDAANRNSFGITPVGRLREGVTLQQAQEAADAVAAEGRRTIPMDASIGYHVSLALLRQHLVAQVRPAILALMGSVIFLLLIACANVANLLLVRASLREQEFAVRAAMGANRRQLIAPLFTEACLLALVGTAAGLALAWAGIRELRHLAPANLPRLDSIGIDGTVLVFAALAGLAAAVLFGLAPAWRASQPALMNVLRGSSRISGLASGAVLRNAVVMAEVALSFVLLVGSGLMFRSFIDLQRIDPGFDPHHLLTFEVLGVNGRPGMTGAEREAVRRRIEDRLLAIPGVQSVAASTPFPLTGGYSPVRWGTEAAQADPSRYQATDLQIVIPGYFEAMRTPLLAGRTFTEDDEQPGRNYVVVDEDLAKKAFPGQSAVGKRILTRVQTPQAVFVQIIGVVAHQREESLEVPGREQIFFADGYFGGFSPPSWAIRTASDPASYEGEVRAAIAGLSRSYMVDKMEPAEEVVHDAQAGTRFSLLLLLAFAIIAGTLAAIGLYGVLSTAVRQRTSEIGVRMAMGADRGDIVQLVVRQGLRLSAIGIVVGIIAAFVLGRVMTAMLVGVKATDPMTFVAMTVVFLTIAVVASWLPARRAAGLDPKTALQEQ